MINFLLYAFTTAIIPQAEVGNITDLPKFWLLQDLYDALINGGMGLKLSTNIVFIAAILVLVVNIWLLNMFITRISLIFVKSHQPPVKVYDVLIEQKFFSRLSVLIAIVIALFCARILFSGFANNWVKFVTIIARSAMIVWILLLLYSLLSSWERLFTLRPKAQQKSFKGYIQIIKKHTGCYCCHSRHINDYRQGPLQSFYWIWSYRRFYYFPF